MKTQKIYLVVIVLLLTHCKKKNSIIISNQSLPTVKLVSTNAILLDTVWSAPKRYMHFKITFDVITTNSDIYFSQIPLEYQTIVDIHGPDSIYEHTVFRPMILTNIPEIIPEIGIYKISADDTIRITYLVMMIAHGSWTNYYMRAYRFPYSLGNNDGIYESTIDFNNLFITEYPR